MVPWQVQETKQDYPAQPALYLVESPGQLLERSERERGLECRQPEE